VLRRKNSYILSLWMLPLFTFLTVWIGCFYIIQKGPKLSEKVDNAKNAWISTCFAAGGALIAGLVGVPLIKRQVGTGAVNCNAFAAAKLESFPWRLGIAYIALCKCTGVMSCTSAGVCSICNTGYP
jgi:hypothetical protein